MTALPALIRTPATPVWFLLVVSTAVSWWLGADHGLDDHQAATVLVMTVAFMKTSFIGAYFMELRHAPLPLKLGFQAWCVVVCVAVLLIYLVRG
ncbi:MAG TPA: cytochrome C oxidase subunit IV family protein [Baekduia sp.]|nr:cytochrome C oxidase subunit IV family protein [Baekduia sp.]